MRTLASLAALGLALNAAPAAAAVTPMPTAAPSGSITTLRQAKQPTKLLPVVKMHADYEVEVNKLGQVTKVRSAHDTKDLQFNALTYGNVLQMAIRTEDGMHAVVGVYQVDYDFNPATKSVKRSMKLLSEGGVDPEARGAVYALQDLEKSSNARADAAAKAAAARKRPLVPAPTPTATIRP